MSWVHRRGLRFKLMLLCVVTITVVLIGVGAVQYGAQRAQAISQLSSTLDAAVARLSNGLVSPIWDLQAADALTLLRNEMSAPEIVASSVSVEDGAVFAAIARHGDALVESQGGKLPEWRSALAGAAVEARSFDIRKGDKVIARGEILYSREHVDRQLRANLAFAILQVLLVDGLLLAVLYAVLSALVLRPIQRLGLEASRLRDAVHRGELDVRADTASIAAEFRPALEGLNEVLEAVVQPLRVASRCLDRISKGDIPPLLTENFHGEFNEIQSALNRCIGAVNRLVADAQQLSRAAVEGRLDARGDASALQGDFREVILGVNATLDSVVAPVKETARVLNDVAARDLTARVGGEYRGDHADLKEAVNATAAALEEALLQVAGAARQVSTASRQIAAASQSVASGASEQASALEETSASLATMSAGTQRLAADAASADGLAAGARTAAQAGSEAVADMSRAMARIRASADGTSQIIKEVNEIAFQTNLLALNAAVEAARAGEAGRGFAVVAEEVRSLALRSKEAASKTEALIRESVQEAEGGEATADRVSRELGGIVEVIGKVSDLVTQITASARDQASGIGQVTKAVAAMDQVTQQNAASSEQSSSSSQELSGQAEALSDLVGTFQLAPRGDAGARDGRPHAGLPARRAASTAPSSPALSPAALDQEVSCPRIVSASSSPSRASSPPQQRQRHRSSW